MNKITTFEEAVPVLMRARGYEYLSKFGDWAEDCWRKGTEYISTAEAARQCKSLDVLAEIHKANKWRHWVMSYTITPDGEWDFLITGVGRFSHSSSKELGVAAAIATANALSETEGK